MKENSFPPELLTKSKAERFKYFEEFIIVHPILEEVLEKILQTIDFSKKGRIINVFGSTGVGKTTLIQTLNKKIIEKYLDMIRKDRNFVPLVSVEAPMPTIGNFSWADLFSDMLEQLNEFAAERQFLKNSQDEVYAERKQFFERFGYNRPSRLRYVLEKSLNERTTKLVSIDEAQHLCVLSSARKLLDQPNTIKSLSNRTKAIYILFGNYDLLLFKNLNGQLSRRTDDIHFRRYDWSMEEDVESFQDIIWTFQNQLPVKRTLDFLNIWEYLYERSVGCVGILKEWLDRAFKLMLDKNDNHFTIKHLNATELSESKCITIANEIIAAENNISEVYEGKTSLSSILRENKEEKSNSKQRKQSKQKRVGERKPNRDKAGEGEYDGNQDE